MNRFSHPGIRCGRKKIFLKITIMFVLFLSSFTIQAQFNLPRIAVIPFTALNLEKETAAIYTGLFETALVNTHAFIVIELTQMEQILKTQQASLFDCVDTSCAIRVGKLLSAEQIVIGTISNVEGEYLVNIKIVDVTSGKNLKAENTAAPTLSALRMEIEQLAGKMAGQVTLSTNKPIGEWVDLFIETDPVGAEIFINGEARGTSPDLVEHLPAGSLTIEVKKEKLYAKKTLLLTSGNNRVSIKLAPLSGNLFIKANSDQAEVLLDGKSLGALNNGLFENIDTGNYLLELLGDYAYWSGDVTINGNTITKVNALLTDYGVVNYVLNEGVVAELASKTQIFTFSGTGKSNIDADVYMLTVSGENYQSYTDSIIIQKGADYTIAPALVYTDEYRSILYHQRIAEFESLAAGTAPIRDSDILDIEQFIAELGSATAESVVTDSTEDSATISADGFEQSANAILASIKQKQIRQKSEAELKGLLIKKSDIRMQLATTIKKRKVNKAFGWGSITTGVVLSGVTALLWYLSKEPYNNYVNASNSADALQYRNQVENYDRAIWLSLGLSANMFFIGSATLITLPTDASFSIELETIENRITTITQELK